MRPRVLLFDKPTLPLDPQLVGEVLPVIRGLAHAHGLTMLLVSHEMAAREVLDWICVFDQADPLSERTRREYRTREFLSSVLA